jgi:hypothetical protein
MTPAAKGLIQVELPPTVAFLAITSLNVAKPITSNINTGSQNADRDSSKYQDQPYMTGI